VYKTLFSTNSIGCHLIITFFNVLYSYSFYTPCQYSPSSCGVSGSRTACFAAPPVSYGPTAIQAVPIIYTCPIGHRTPALFIYLSHIIFVLNLAWLHMMWKTLCGSEFLTKTRCANMRYCATLTLSDRSSYFAEEL